MSKGESELPLAELGKGRRERPSESGTGEIPAGITLRPITDDDMEFLFRLYASTRADEKALFGWSDDEWDNFMRMQFHLQHTQYMQSYDNPSFDVIMLGRTPVGRLYVNRGEDEIRIIDISLMPGYRGLGIGASLMGKILLEGDAGGVPVSLHVERNNPALALYRRLGFKMEDSTDVYCFMKRPPTNAEPIPAKGTT